MNEENSIVAVSGDKPIAENANLTKSDTGKNPAAALKSVSEAALKAGKAFVDAPLPQSINWLYGFGFKIGILIILKSFLVLRYQWNNLSREGFLVASSQLLLAIVFIACGLIMQTPGILSEPSKVRTVTGLYFVVGAIATVVGIKSGVQGWDFFIVPQKVNIFTTVFKGAGQLTTSVLFIDRDLWAFFAVLLFAIAVIHMCVMYGPGAAIGIFTEETGGGSCRKFDFKSWIVTAASAVLSLIILFGVPKLAFVNRTQPGVSAKDFKSYSYIDAEEKLTEAGFTNIEFIAEYNKNGKGIVTQVSIGGNSSFAADSYFAKETEVVVTYKDNYSDIIEPKITAYLDEDNKTIEIKKGTAEEGSWSSSDESIVIVDENGELTAVDTGKAQVTVVIDGVQYTCDIVVKATNSVIKNIGNTVVETEEDLANWIKGLFK